MMVPGMSCFMASLHLTIKREIGRWLGTPQIEGVFWCMVAGLPALRGRDEVDVAGIFRVATPWILDVVEIVGAQHVTAEPPAPGIALARHVHGAEPNVIDAAHVPAAMMQP